MAKYELLMPKMGEGVIEATILKWVKNPGDEVVFDDTVVEIATDKVDSEIPSPVDGKISAIHFNENDVVAVGEVIAIIETEGEEATIKEETPAVADKKEKIEISTSESEKNSDKEGKKTESISSSSPAQESKQKKSFKFYSPLVRSIAARENISIGELESIKGSGENGRIIKKDIEAYIENRGKISTSSAPVQSTVSKQSLQANYSSEDNVEIIEMDRMRKLIADYMVESKRIAPHVTSMVEADLTNVVNWRKKNKDAFFEKYNQKLTFTPIFIGLFFCYKLRLI